jgi:tetratricopeptide (TPR) repeat protein
MEYGELGRFDAARHHFEQALQLDPQNAHLHSALLVILLRIGDVAGAMRHARSALELSPDDPGMLATLATVLEADRQMDAAWKIVDELLSANRLTTPLVLLFAMMSPQRHDEAKALSLIDQHLDTAKDRPTREQASLHFAAANLLDRLGRYDDAFERASRANTLRGAQYDSALAERLVDQFIEYFSRETLSRLPRSNHGIDTPVFIVGMPRSGTSLVEQILSSHAAIFGLGERDWVFRLWEMVVQRFGGPTSPLSECLDRLSLNDVNDLAVTYHHSMRQLSPYAARVTDKTPANFMHLGLVALLFPKARVIYCRRDLLDTCLSCYMTDFAAGSNFSFDLASAGHFHRQNDRLMAHWKSALDLPILEVEYEKVVGDLEGQTRRMLEFLGMPWDDDCVRFHESQRVVATASRDQVRQPIYQTSVGRWRHYEKHLAPLQAALQTSQ